MIGRGVASLAAAALLAGCVTVREDGGRARTGADASARDAAPVSGTVDTSLLDKPIARRVPDIRSFIVRAEIQPRGTTPYDDMTLPLFAPDGLRLAMQVGLAPEWATILAESGAALAPGVRVELLALDPDTAERPSPYATIDEDVLLGRGADAIGVLVESPRPDGTRWIGRARWADGAVEWLAQEPGRACAFAALGDGGALAWCSRAVDGDEFDLVVRLAGKEWRMRAGGGRQWLMPTWSGVGNGLFALLLDNGALDLVHLDASSEAAALRSLRRLPLAQDGATVGTAYQCVAASTGRASAVAAPTVEQIVFQHPVRYRTCVWRPAETWLMLERGSIAAAIDPENEDTVLVTMPDRLVRQSLGRARDHQEVVRGLHVVRAIGDPVRTFMLVQPFEHELGIAVLRFLPPEE